MKKVNIKGSPLKGSITKPQYILGNPQEIIQLFETTKDGKLISRCDSLESYMTLTKTLRSDKDKRGVYTEKQFTGIVCGQPFLNYCLVKFGADFGLLYDKPASVHEDIKESTDTWCNIKNGGRARVSLKFFINGHDEVTMPKLGNFLARLAIDHKKRLDNSKSQEIIPVLFDTCFDIDHIVEEHLVNGLQGTKIGRQDIINRVLASGNSFFKDFVKMLKSNYDYFKEKQKLAFDLAKTKRDGLVLDKYDNADIQTMIETDFGIFVATPGWGKTTIEALGSMETRLKDGPIIVVSRVKFLLDQVMRDWVEMIQGQNTADGHPERILLGSMVDHSMDLKFPTAVGPVSRPDIEQAVKDAYDNKTPTLIGCVGWNDTPTLKKLLSICEKGNYPVRLVIDEALEVFGLSKTLPETDNPKRQSIIDKDLVTLLEKIYAKGQLKMLHGYDAIFSEGPWGMTNKLLGLPDKPLVTHTSTQAIETGRTVPLTIVKHRVYEKDIKKLLKKYPGIEFDDFVEANLNVSFFQYVNEKEDVPKLLAFTRGTNQAHFLTNDIKEKYDPDQTGVILARTSLEKRNKLKQAMNDPLASCFIANIKIASKGININNCKDVSISPNAELNEEYAVHIPPRVVRRAEGDRGKPLNECAKQYGRLHLGYVVAEDGTISKSAKRMESVIEEIKKTGIHHQIQEIVYTPPKQRKITTQEWEDDEYVKQAQSTVSDSNILGKIQVVDEPDPILKEWKLLKGEAEAIDKAKNKSFDEILGEEIKIND
jgi:hypothetical protein|tara:strand:+ start:7192 stop:9483 length:2292 start_codon:yes stop_codon:yes gene_type:complete